MIPFRACVDLEMNMLPCATCFDVELLMEHTSFKILGLLGLYGGLEWGSVHSWLVRLGMQVLLMVYLVCVWSRVDGWIKRSKVCSTDQTLDPEIKSYNLDQ